MIYNIPPIVTDIIIIFWIHFITDFVLQSSWMAQNKSKAGNLALEAHVLVYTIPLLYFGWLFALVNGLAHYITDFITSKLSSEQWKNGKVHNFFVVVGFDQAIHNTTLVLTYWWLVA